MKNITYNDTEFTVEQSGYDIRCKRPDGSTALIAVNMFIGMDPAEAEAKAKALIKSIQPVGVKIVGPDVSRPNTIGGMKLVGPDVARPNFVHWDKDSTSFPKGS